MKIAYVEDDADARAIFARRLAADRIACDVLGDAESALAAIRPGSHDLLLIDVRLPGRSGTELLQALRARQVHAPCILITAFSSLQHARDALNASASYLLEKPFSYQALRQVIDRVAASPGSLQHCVDRGLAQLGLTEREEAIARYLLKGLSNAEIARLASLSEKTVKHHLGQVFQKAGVASRAELFSSIFPV